jgi:hypothetical protein
VKIAALEVGGESEGLDGLLPEGGKGIHLLITSLTGYISYDD